MNICRCNCKTGEVCKTKRCRCRKQGPVCSDACGCDPKVCRNRDIDNRSALSDLSNNDTANTNSLLNDTYTHAVLGGRNSGGGASSGGEGSGGANRTFGLTKKVYMILFEDSLKHEGFYSFSPNVPLG